jgi:hypothetical protein
VRSVDQLPRADHLLEDLAKFGHKAERDMKVKTFERPIYLGFLLESNTQIWHFFSGYFIGILISDYCTTPQKIIFLAFSIFNFARKSNTPLLSASRSQNLLKSCW